MQLTLSEIHKERDILLSKIKDLVSEFEQLSQVTINTIHIEHMPMFTDIHDTYIGSIISSIYADINYEEHPIKGFK